MSDRINYTSNSLSNIQAGELRAKYSATGDRILRYYIDFRHLELNFHKELSAPELSILQNKVDTLMMQWDKKYEVHTKKQDAAAGKEMAEDLTVEAEARRNRLQNTLHHTLSIDDTVDWDVLKDHSKFERKSYPKQLKTVPLNFTAPRPLRISFFQVLFGRRKELTRQHEQDVEHYVAQVARVKQENAAIKADWVKARDEWNAEQDRLQQEFKDRQDRENAKVDVLAERWQAGDATAIEEHASIVLEASEHDEIITKQWDIQYDAESKTLLLDFALPTPDDIPTTKTVRFVASTGGLKETQISAKDKKTLFDDLCFQLCLRTIHELFEADSHDHLQNIVFNGSTDSIDRSTGQQVHSTIISLMVGKDEFSGISLADVDPKACFKSLKGVSAASLVGLTPIAPIMELDKEDRRFVDARAVTLEHDGTTNLAAMDWEEFEHLVREVFDREFALRGGEVRVTQSSSDGGVDAVAFDPDPISGGKIIIQAKRYTKTVGVGAVRDLYGTTMNEGAIKGILVTTADYGPDAHKFASDKPLTLISGSHLLHLLERHGVKAKIDIREARKEMGLVT